MKLPPDHTQRLNLPALLGAQRGQASPFGRAIWAFRTTSCSTQEDKAVEVSR